MNDEEVMLAPGVTVVVPAFNEGGTIASTVSGVRELYPDVEILVIDDGSTDDTAEQAVSAGARVVKNDQNRGYGASLKRGILRARGEVIVTLDADGQHAPEDIGRLIKALDESAMVVGARTGKEMMTSRKPGKWLLTAVAQYLINQHIPDLNSGLRAFYREDALRYMPILPNGFSFTTTITLAMLKDGREVRYLPIAVSPRDQGRSDVKFLRDGGKTLLLILRVIMLFNPLKVFAPLSAVLIAVGVAYTIFMLIVYSNISDTTTLFLLAGIGTLFFGLLADQLSNIRRGG